MALQTSGAISLNDIHVEAGGSSGTTATINDSDIRGLISKASGATMSFNEWYGASSGQDIVVTQGTSSAPPAGAYYGFRLSSPAMGSRSPTSFYNASNTQRTVTGLYIFRSGSNTYFYVEMSHSTANSIGATELSSVEMTCNGTLTTLLTSAGSTTTIAGGYQRRWLWYVGNGMSTTQRTNINTEWDGSGNITVKLITP